MKRVRCYYHKPDPPNTKRCVRPGKFGNHFRLGHPLPAQYYNEYSELYQARYRRKWILREAEEAVRLFVKHQLPKMPIHELKDFDHLACFCKESAEWCHVDAIINELLTMNLIIS